MPTLGERFKQLRIEKKLTQQELANDVNRLNNLTFSKSSISQYENNKVIPEMPAMVKFADYFDVSIDYLMGRSNIRNPKEGTYYNSFNSISTNGLCAEDIEMVKFMVENLKKRGNK